MTEKEIFNSVLKSTEDVLQVFLRAITSAGVDYCVIGGLAVNAYAEPVVSLDLDVVVTIQDIDRIRKILEEYFRVEQFEHSVNLSSDKSSLRIQLQTDQRYVDFIPRAKVHTVLGYEMNVAAPEDVLQGKIWAFLDEERRNSKRQKDLSDILRLIESFPPLSDRLPEEIRKKLE